jgi:hypothetical protein
LAWHSIPEEAAPLFVHLAPGQLSRRIWDEWEAGHLVLVPRREGPFRHNRERGLTPGWLC